MNGLTLISSWHETGLCRDPEGFRFHQNMAHLSVTTSTKVRGSHQLTSVTVQLLPLQNSGRIPLLTTPLKGTPQDLLNGPQNPDGPL